MIAGLGFLALGMIGALLLVSDFVFGGATAAVVAGSLAVLFALIWVGLPLLQPRGERG